MIFILVVFLNARHALRRDCGARCKHRLSALFRASTKHHNGFTGGAKQALVFQDFKHTARHFA